jgi:hypothetical protein
MRCRADRALALNPLIASGSAAALRRIFFIHPRGTAAVRGEKIVSGQAATGSRAFRIPMQVPDLAISPTEVSS